MRVSSPRGWDQLREQNIWPVLLLCHTVRALLRKSLAAGTIVRPVTVALQIAGCSDSALGFSQISEMR